MDNYKGGFTDDIPPDVLKQYEEAKTEHDLPPGVFREGEIVEMRGSKFRIMRMRPNGTLVLKLQKKNGAAI
jgi:hypothetical protein